MVTSSAVVSCVAVAVAAIAAAHDIRFGTIPNWLSIPPILLAPLTYASLVGFGLGVQSLLAGIAAGIGPYVLFRLQGLGGGDVKLFASLGAIAGFDPMAGLRIELIAFVVALVMALIAQAVRGRLRPTLSALLISAANVVLPMRRSERGLEAAKTPVRMGGAILVGTVIALLPYLGRPLTIGS